MAVPGYITAVERKPIFGKHREIAVRYAWHERQARKNAWPAFGPKKYQRGSPHLIALVRLRELERLFRFRYGATLPYDDAGLEDLSIAAHHIANLRGEAFEHIVAFAARWMPELPRRRAEALAETVLAEPRKFKAATLGWQLRLTARERAALRVTTIAAVGMSAAETIERRKLRARERAAASYRRRQAGKPPKPEPLCRAQPWKALNISRATWFRKGRPTAEPSETKPSAQQVGPENICCADVLVSPTESEGNQPGERSGRELKTQQPPQQVTCATTPLSEGGICIRAYGAILSDRTAGKKSGKSIAEGAKKNKSACPGRIIFRTAIR